MFTQLGEPLQKPNNIFGTTIKFRANHSYRIFPFLKEKDNNDSKKKIVVLKPLKNVETAQWSINWDDRCPVKWRDTICYIVPSVKNGIKFANRGIRSKYQAIQGGTNEYNQHRWLDQLSAPLSAFCLVEWCGQRCARLSCTLIGRWYWGSKQGHWWIE